MAMRSTAAQWRLRRLGAGGAPPPKLCGGSRAARLPPPLCASAPGGSGGGDATDAVSSLDRLLGVQEGGEQPKQQPSTLKSLDSLLGSADEAAGGAAAEAMAAADAAARAARQAANAAAAAAAAAADDGVQLVAAIDGETTSEMLTAPVREPPIVTWGIYYTSLWCYASYFTVDLIQGEDTAEDLLSRVVNDHGAVAGGDVLPLLSGGFVTTSPFSLAILLVTLLSVAVELEAVLGHGSFWAIYSLSVITGSLADAAFSDLPITFGPSAAVAGMVGALIAHTARNWRFEQQLLAAKTGDMGSYDDGDQNNDGNGGPFGGGPRVETELKIPVPFEFDLPGIRFVVPRDLKSAATLGSSAVAAVNALADSSGIASAGATADWWGLAGGLLAGSVLGLGMCPTYELVPWTGPTSSGSFDGGEFALASPSARGRVVSRVEGGDGAVIVDRTSNAQRAAVALGYTAALFGAITTWLVANE